MFILFNGKCKVYVEAPAESLDARRHWYDDLFPDTDTRGQQLAALEDAPSDKEILLDLGPDPFGPLPRFNSKHGPPNEILGRLAKKDLDKRLNIEAPPQSSDLFQHFDRDSTAQLRDMLITNPSANSLRITLRIWEIIRSIEDVASRPDIRAIVLKRTVRDVTGLSCSYSAATKDMVTRQETPARITVMVPAGSLRRDPANILLGIAFECFNATNSRLFSATTRLAIGCTLGAVEQSAWKCAIELDTYIKAARLYAQLGEEGNHVTPQEMRHLVSMDHRLAGARGWLSPSYRPSASTVSAFAMSSHNPGLATTAGTTFYSYCGTGMGLGIRPSQLLSQVKKWYQIANDLKTVKIVEYKKWFGELSSSTLDEWSNADDHRLLELLHALRAGCKAGHLPGLLELLQGWALPETVFDEYARRTGISRAVSELIEDGMRVPDVEFWGRFDYSKLDPTNEASFLVCRPIMPTKSKLGPNTEPLPNPWAQPTIPQVVVDAMAVIASARRTRGDDFWRAVVGVLQRLSPDERAIHDFITGLGNVDPVIPSQLVQWYQRGTWGDQERDLARQVGEIIDEVERERGLNRPRHLE
jgi:hypothetical protein